MLAISSVLALCSWLDAATCCIADAKVSVPRAIASSRFVISTTRSFDPAAGYGPLYQAAYLLGALQLRGLRAELVDSRQMTERAFHDEIMRQGSMPIGLLRLALTKQKLSRDMNLDWQFYGDLPGK